MNKESETAGDREFFSELVETPIHPLLIKIFPSFVNEINPMLYFQLSGEALWRLREVCGQPSTVLQLLQSSILPLGYRLTESAGERVGSGFSRKYQAALKKESKRQNPTTKRKQMRGIKVGT